MNAAFPRCIFGFLLTIVTTATAMAAGKTTAVTVSVPVGATLTINGQPTSQMTAVRQFVTPELPVGPKFRYIFEATFTWNGEEMTKRKQVDLTAGTTVSVDMMQGETIVRPRPRDEEEVKPVEPPKPAPKPEAKPEPKPEPPKPEPKPKPPEAPAVPPAPKPEPPKPAPPVEKPKPEVPKPAPVAEPQRPLAPKPREVQVKTKK